jgi:hypothetical protein
MSQPPPPEGQGQPFGQGQPSQWGPQYGPPPGYGQGQYPGQYGADPYGQPGQGGQYYGKPPRRGNGLAVAALVVGIFALLLCWTIIGGIGLGLIALVLGVIGLSRSRSDGASGGGLAIGGIALGMLGVIASIVLVIVGIGIFNAVGGGDYVDCVNDAGNDQTAVQRCNDEFHRNIEDRFGVTLTPESAPA